MFTALALGLCLCRQQKPEEVMKANQDTAIKLIRDSGFAVTPGPTYGYTITRDNLQFKLGIIGINAGPTEQGFAVLSLTRFYRPSKHVSMSALADVRDPVVDSPILHFVQRVNGDIEAKTGIFLRRDETPLQLREILNKCFSDLSRAGIKGGLMPSDGSVTPFPDDNTRIDMAKPIDYLSDRDLIYLTDEVWGWKDRTPSGHTGPWSHSVQVNGVRIIFAHPGNMVHIGSANGIGIDGQIGDTPKSSDHLQLELQKELGDGIKLFHAEPTPSTHFGVQALIEYGNGITLRDLHDRIVKFADVMAKHQ